MQEAETGTFTEAEPESGLLYGVEPDTKRLARNAIRASGIWRPPAIGIINSCGANLHLGQCQGLDLKDSRIPLVPCQCAAERIEAGSSGHRPTKS